MLAAAEKANVELLVLQAMERILQERDVFIITRFSFSFFPSYFGYCCSLLIDQ